MSQREAAVALQHTLYQSRNPTRRYLHCARRDWVRARLGDCGAHALAMELGPGSGVYLPTLAAGAQQVVALDVDAAQLSAARQALPDLAGRCSVHFLQADLCALPIASGSVDVLLCSEVIEHVEYSAQLLASCESLLAEDGIFILTTPQPLSPIELLSRIAFLPGILQLLRRVYREPIEPTGHINVLGQAELEQQIRHAGLRVVERDTLGFYLPLIGEFGGKPGQRLLAVLERLLCRSPLRFLLWTQCYVLRKADGTE
ncbi:MAG: class I SAM-dependent methyltransferase [Congregibacter sp.]